MFEGGKFREKTQNFWDARITSKVFSIKYFFFHSFLQMRKLREFATKYRHENDHTRPIKLQYSDKHLSEEKVESLGQVSIIHGLSNTTFRSKKHNI